VTGGDETPLGLVADEGAVRATAEGPVLREPRTRARTPIDARTALRKAVAAGTCEARAPTDIPAGPLTGAAPAGTRQ